MRASAPASSGNLGPGFDVLGLALDLRCVVDAVPADRMTVDDGDGPVTLAAGDMLFDAVMVAAGRPMALTVDNAIPRARGLGSSSAVTTAAAAAAQRALGAEPIRRHLLSRCVYIRTQIYRLGPFSIFIGTNVNVFLASGCIGLQG